MPALYKIVYGTSTFFACAHIKGPRRDSVVGFHTKHKLSEINNIIIKNRRESLSFFPVSVIDYFVYIIIIFNWMCQSFIYS